MALVEIHELKIKLGNRIVVNGFSGTFLPGTISAIVGPNGSGKTSLIGALAGDLEPISGAILINGRALSELSLKESADLRSVVMQNRSYWLSYTGREVLEMGQNSAAINRIDQAIKELSMQGFIDQKITTLSGGEAQRVEIARALIRDSDLYLLDEPFAAQDWQSKARIIDILQNLRRSGKTIILIAHSDVSSLTWCDQILELGA